MPENHDSFCMCVFFLLKIQTICQLKINEKKKKEKSPATDITGLIK